MDPSKIYIKHSASILYCREGNYFMSRGKQLRMNTVVGVLSQLATLICGFVIPKLILSYYGTEVNGLVSSITHFLSFISLAECGMGVVVQSSLYKPLAERDDNQISQVIVSSDRFFGKIGIIPSKRFMILLSKLVHIR